ncbi:MobP2 family relaxase [Bacillus thuringiensis]|uniref:MobP2 family relaxase n=1 Tax=Bacillus sp. GC_Bacil_1 TaxID=2937370 RepID=UPI00226B9E6F|nr:MobP2 family relaxase [Bacillus sp. GC_Bacil_1]
MSNAVPVQSSVTPGVVLKTKFVLPSSDAFQNYIDYVNREEAKSEVKLNPKMFETYQDYMGNSEKKSALFTEHANRLTESEKKSLKEMFKTAHENGSIMWQDVISFHNPWLEKQGIYDEKTKTLDEKKLMDVTRLAMKEMQKREGLEKGSIWSAAIHFNTDNIHIHVATVEPFPTRERGKRKPKTLDAMKGKVVNNLLDRKQEQKQINDLIRNNMVGRKKEDSVFDWRNQHLKPLFLQIYKQLPSDKRQWQYSYNTIQPLKPQIDELSSRYIQHHHKKDYDQFLKKLDKEVQVFKEAYGEGKYDKKQYENYKTNKINDLYKRMGNAFLQEMKAYDKEQKRIHHMKKSKSFRKFQQNVSIQYSMRKVEGAFKSEYESWKNQKYYERMQRENAYENERG